MTAKKASKFCCVVGCRNNNVNAPPGTIFYTWLVRDYRSIQREKWLKAVKRVNADGSAWEPTTSSRICSRHFIGNKQSNHPRSPSFVPSIFPKEYGPTTSTEKSRQNSLDRFQRTMDRNLKSTVGVSICSFQPSVEIQSQVIQPEQLVATDMDVSPECTSQSVGTQVDFLDDSTSDLNIFMCNRYSAGGVSVTETQACIPVSSKKNIFAKKKDCVDRGCGETIFFADKLVGPNPTEINTESLLKCKSGFHGLTSITDDQDLIDLAGVSFASFNLLLKVLIECDTSVMKNENRLLIFLFKMKLGLSFSSLGVLFGVHRTTVSRMFYSVLDCLSQACAKFVMWPPKETIQSTMPDSFKQSYKNCRVIDCTEFPVEQPPLISQRVHFYSHYKKGYTLKVLVGCTPNGFISFVSKCFGGRTTDAQITNQSGFLNFLEPGDVVLADKGFPEIKTALDDTGKGILVVMPPFLRNNHFSAEEVQETQKVASIRIHIERIMQRIKTYRILSKFSISMLPYADQIVFMACVLVNLQPPILKTTDT